MTKAYDWVKQPWVSRVLVALSVPRTPRQLEKRLGIKKLKMRPFTDKGLAKVLNPRAKKGRLYTVTEKGRRIIKLPNHQKTSGKRYSLHGYVAASPRQREVILRVMDFARRTSEDIRSRASRYNPLMTRVSVKAVLKSLASKGLVRSELIGRRRLYWITQKGSGILADLALPKA
jgi:predicted transcriptional regulator